MIRAGLLSIKHEVKTAVMTRVIIINGLGPFSVLANDMMDPVHGDDGKLYKSVCHAYYSYLAGGDSKRAANVRAARSVADAQTALGIDTLIAAHNPRKHSRAYNMESTIGLLRHVLDNKLIKSRWARETLMATYGSDIIVIQGNDEVLGAGKARRGLNLTGIILMELRDYYVSRGGLRAPEFNVYPEYG